MGLFGFLSRLFGFSKTPVKLIVLGLDNSGKTTLVSHLKPENGEGSFEVVPTVGFSVEKFRKGKIDFTVFDMSGQSTYRGLWEAYYAEVQAIVWVVDSSDKLRMSIAKHELFTLLEHKDLNERNVPILFFANKMDTQTSLSPVDCMQLLSLEQIKNKTWHITGSNAITGEGVDDGMQWLGETLSKLNNSGK
jgi:ADP-ribosylation factor-like protein 6|tara:strand:- start:325 stop:897 length:573 start_codon:yes stop_codon:yes gene_type:complete